MSPEVTRLDWMVSQVAMKLVLRGDGERRGTLARLGVHLVGNARTSDHGDVLVARRWAATELNVASYRADTQAKGTTVSVEYNPDILNALAKGAAAAQRGVNGRTNASFAVHARRRQRAWSGRGLMARGRRVREGSNRHGDRRRGRLGGCRSRWRSESGSSWRGGRRLDTSWRGGRTHARRSAGGPSQPSYDHRRAFRTTTRCR